MVGWAGWAGGWPSIRLLFRCMRWGGVSRCCCIIRKPFLHSAVAEQTSFLPRWYSLLNSLFIPVITHKLTLLFTTREMRAAFLCACTVRMSVRNWRIFSLGPVDCGVEAGASRNCARRWEGGGCTYTQGPCTYISPASCSLCINTADGLKQK